MFAESEAKVNILNKAGVTPLHEAVIRGDLGIARILLEHGATLNIKAKTGCVSHIHLFFLTSLYLYRKSMLLNAMWD